MTATETYIKAQKIFAKKHPDIIEFWKEFDALTLEDKLKMKAQKQKEYESLEPGNERQEFYIKYRPVLKFYKE